MKRYIVIEYNPDSAQGGEPIDLFNYLGNELDNANIFTRMEEVSHNPLSNNTRRQSTS